MRVRIIYTLTKTLLADGTYRVAVQVDSTEGITPKIFVHRDGVFVSTARPVDIELYPEDAPEQEGGLYRRATGEVIVDDVSSALSSASAIGERIDALAEQYQAQAGDYDGTEQVEVEYGN